MEVTLVPDALCVPPICDPNYTPRRRRGGVFSHGHFVDEAALRRQYIPESTPAAAIEPLQLTPLTEIRRECIFGGYLFDHYGHFLLETLARLRITADFPQAPVVFLRQYPSGGAAESLLDQAIQILRVPNEVLILDTPVSVSRLLVPSAGYEIQYHFRGAHARFLAAFDAAEPMSRKVWLSRSGLPGRTEFGNEVELERELAGLGWLVFRPEQAPLHTQLSVIGSANQLSGLDGSAFHTVVLLKRFQGRLKLMLRKRLLNQNFLTIADRLGLSQDVILPPQHIELDENGKVARRTLDTNAAIEILEDLA